MRFRTPVLALATLSLITTSCGDEVSAPFDEQDDEEAASVDDDEDDFYEDPDEGEPIDDESEVVIGDDDPGATVRAAPTRVVGFATSVLETLYDEPVVKVTNLNDSGAGSLRAALSGNHRIVVFEVSGVITLKSILAIRGTDILVAGETAPAPGIAIIGHSLRITGKRIVLRHLRVRLGGSYKGANADQGDVMQTNGSPSGDKEIDHIWIDHCSLAFGTDEQWQTYYPTQHHITISNSLLTDPLCSVGHPSGNHCFNMLFSTGSKTIDVQRSLIANGARRNPRITNGVSLAFFNNIVFNWGGVAIELGDNSGRQPLRDNRQFASIFGNYFIPGTNTKQLLPVTVHNGAPYAGSRFYYEDNSAWDRSAKRIVPASRTVNQNGGIAKNFVTTDRPPVWLEGAAPGTVWSAMEPQQLYTTVIGYVGAWPRHRDSVDARTIADLQKKTGRHRQNLADAGGLPTLARNTRRLSVPSGAGRVRAWLEEHLVAVQGY